MKEEKYMHTKELLTEITAMLETEKLKEIERHFGLTGDRPEHNLLKRKYRPHSIFKRSAPAGKMKQQIDGLYRIDRDGDVCGLRLFVIFGWELLIAPKPVLAV